MIKIKKTIKNDTDDETTSESIDESIDEIIGELTEEENILKTKNFKENIEKLPKNYFGSYEKWRDLCFMLHNEFIGNKTGYDLFYDVSKNNDKFDEKACYEQYYKKTKERTKNQPKITFGTLNHWVKEDGINFHNLWDKTFTSGLMAEYFIDKYPNKFVTVKDVAYFFNDLHWEQDSKNNSNLTKFINNTFIKDLLKDCYRQKNLNLDLSMSEEERKLKDEKMQTYEKKVQNLRDISNRDKLIKDIVNLNTNNDIEFDKNNFLFVFKNSIYDLEKDIFIEPNPKDYLLNTCGYNYIESSEEHKKILMDLFETIFTDKDNREDYLTTLSTGLCGIQLENLFICTGSGGNGKSLINSLMMKTVGNYGYKLPNSVLLNVLKTGGNPEVALLNNKRFVLCQEPPNNQRIKSGTIKEITGDKTLNARLNHSNECNVNLKLTLLLECNDMPLMDEVNDAIIRRLRISVFNSLFVSQDTYNNLDEEEKKNIFLGIPEYKSDIWQDKFKCVLFDILKDYFKIFRENKYILGEQPQINKDKCKVYLGASDNIYDWFQGFYERNTEESKEQITLTSIFKVFTESKFYETLSKKDKRENNRIKFVDKLEKNIFIKKFIKMNMDKKIKVLTGWKLKETNDEKND
jgi:phage/plasmid-associated DNA primase